MSNKKAVIYARYSSYSQTEQSIEGQIKVCTEYAQKQGYAVVGQYIDRAISGKTDDRPDFQQMIQDSKKKQFDFVIVYKLDRFARNIYDNVVYEHKLKENKVTLVSASESIGDGDEAVIMRSLLVSMAEWYSRDLARKVKRGIEQSVAKGNFIGGHILYGYRVVDKKIERDPDKAPYIEYAFQRYAAGDTMRSIINTLNAKGATNRNGKPLTYTSFSRALKNKKYIGIHEYEGEVYTDTYPPLIDEHTFYIVQDKLSQRAQAPAKGTSSQNYLLSGKAYCGHCGSPLVGECGTSKTKVRHYYYACGKKKKHHTCDKSNEKKDFLEWYVVSQTLEYVLLPQRLDYIADNIIAAYENEIDSGKQTQMERRLRSVERELDKCFNVLSDAISTGSDAMKQRANEKIATLELQKADIEIDLSKFKMAAGIHYTKEEVISWLSTMVQGDPMDDDFRQTIIDTFVNSVYVYDDKLVVYYNIRGGKQISYLENCSTLDKVRISSPVLHQSHPPMWVALLFITTREPWLLGRAINTKYL